jgi:hypothetical protein
LTGGAEEALEQGGSGHRFEMREHAGLAGQSWKGVVDGHLAQFYRGGAEALAVKDVGDAFPRSGRRR